MRATKMMSLHLMLTLATIAGAEPAATPPSVPSLLAIRVGRAETVSKGTIENAVILVENGKIVTIGEDLPVERGIPILDKPNWVVIPGLVNAYSRLGMDSEGGDEMSPEVSAIDELYPQADEYDEVVKYGVTTLGLYPAGNGIPGQAIAVRVAGETPEDMLLNERAYLKIIVRAAANSKKLIRDGFKKADDYDEKDKKAREKWDKEQEKKKKPAPKKTDEKKDEKVEEKKSAPTEDPKPEKTESKEEAKDGSSTYVPPEPDPKAAPFLDLRNGSLRALVSISSAAEYLHFLDAIDKEEFSWDLRIPMMRESDIFYVAKKEAYEIEVDGIGEKQCRVVVEPSLTIHPGTMRFRNLPNELARSGARLVLIPRNDTLDDHKAWLRHTGEIVGAGLDPQVALRALTLEPAELLGVEGRVGSIEKEKDANFVFLSGDPFQPSTRIEAVMLEGRFVHGEVKL